jgi:aminopeptidase N
MPHFHDKSGNGYQFVADSIIEIDKLNPQVAARLTSSFSQWKRFDSHRKELMQKELLRIQKTEGLSKDSFEVASRCLN